MILCIFILSRINICFNQIQKQPRVRASLLVGTRRCHKLYTHAQNVARTHTNTHTYALIHKPKTHARAHTLTRACTHTTHTHTHTHTRLHYFRSLSVSLSPPHEKLSLYHPRTALVPFLSSQKPFPVPLRYPQTKALKMCLMVQRIRTHSLLGTGKPRTAISTFTQLLSSDLTAQKA